METIFGTEMPIAAKVVLALIIVIGMASGVFYVLRYVGANRIGSVGIRGRQPRLAVTEVAAVDPRRRLLLIRRDNVEHLIMIGGPSDIVIEPNIVRAVAVAAARDAAAGRQAGAETRERVNGAADSPIWPGEQTGRPQRPAKPEETPAWPQQPEVAARAANTADHLAGLAAELGRAPAQPDGASTAKREPPKRPAATASSQPAQQTQQNNDQNLTEMAQRLEAALRNSPGSRTSDPPAAGKPAAELSVVASRANGANTNGANTNAANPNAANPGANGVNTHAANELRAPPDMRPPRPEKQAQVKAVYDNLEQEMASLLGRPAGKT
jgi:flagellar protein FliO/FliZ